MGWNFLFVLFVIFRIGFFQQINYYSKVNDWRPGGEIGRRAGLKILLAAMSVRVQVPPGAQVTAVSKEAAFFYLEQQYYSF